MENSQGEIRGDRIESLLTLNEVAQILKISVRSVWRMIDKKDLPEPLKLGRSARFFPSDVSGYLERLKEQRGGCKA